MYLSQAEIRRLGKLLKTFFTLPYSTDLDGKDAETLIRIAKGAEGPRSKRKELFDIVDGDVGYSVKTLFKSPKTQRVDLQEQRFCDVDQIRKMMASGVANNEEQGRILLGYMRSRIVDHMKLRDIKIAKSIILLKHWNPKRTHFSFRYWEEDFLGYIDNLWKRNEKGEIQWVLLEAGIHARDKLRQSDDGKNVRLIRMHHKHNQIFTDHDIPTDAIALEFDAKPLTWGGLSLLLDRSA